MSNDVSRNNGAHPGSRRPHCGAVGEKHLHFFAPQPGITTDELAESVELLMFGIGVLIKVLKPAACDVVYEGMKEETKRHWQVCDTPKVGVVGVAGKPKGLFLPPGTKG